MPRQSARSLLDQLNQLEKGQVELQTTAVTVLERAMRSQNPEVLLKATKIASSIQQRTQSSRKSVIIDPFDLMHSFGYKDKPMMMSYTLLKRMATAPVIDAVIRTRVNQIAAYAEPAHDGYTAGFQIVHESELRDGKQNNSAAIQRKKEALTDFILNCGDRDSEWENDDFDAFIRKFMRDSLIYDQATFEVVCDRRGLPREFLATDASTYRLADSFDDEEYQNNRRAVKEQGIKGYLPSYVQLIDGRIYAEFYPWELAWTIRNPTTDIRSLGYGRSELETLVQTVTAMLWADEYNRRFFSQGSAPKGIIRVKGNVAEDQLSAFKQQWQAMVAGVVNAWKTPIMHAEEADFLNLQTSNKDMEFGAWQEYLIKVSCAIFQIDPSEIGFPMSGSSQGPEPLFGSSGTATRIKHSKDKGLYPLLKTVQQKINKHIIKRIDPEFTFRFTGVDGQTYEQMLDTAIKRVSNLTTVNEERARLDLPPVEGGDVILNPAFLQNKGQEAAAKQQEAMMGQMGGPGEEQGAEEEDADPDEQIQDMEFAPDQDEQGDEVAKAWKRYLLQK